MKHLLALALLVAAVPAGAQRVEVAGGDWSNVPAITAQGLQRISTKSVDKIEELAKSGQCDVPGLTRRRMDLTVPFMLQFSSDGTLQHVVVRRLGCKQLESLMAGVVTELARAGEYKPTGENQLGWYRSELALSLR